jgi:RNA recognition motif-containing protein
MGEFNNENNVNDDVNEPENYAEGANDDSRKVFLSRIAATFDEESITRIFEKSFGEGCIENIALSQQRPDESGDNNGEKDGGGETFMATRKNKQDETPTHRGFAFVTMSTIEKRSEAISKGTIRGKAKDSSKRKHTMYIRPIVRENEEECDDEENNTNQSSRLDICFLWSKYRCPYGDECKFKHDGEGGCIDKVQPPQDAASRMKKQKCFSFRKSGKCKLADKCPYSHDIQVKQQPIDGDDSKKKNEKSTKDKDCINWKTKGKCRKSNCTYKHDESVRLAVLAKKEKKANKSNKRDRGDDSDKTRQPLSVRVFGLNYDTKEEDVRQFFEHCGVIREITFPVYEDSGRSKGYCGVLFTSPKASEKAIEMDGSSLHGRWLSIQGGKMYLKQWEGREQERMDQVKNEKDTTLGEFGQKVKKRKKHGFKDE